ncbi:MAG TPA: acyl-CoA thioester hydrolase/BAAT C-terminal domain-containing protein [Bryobacteraceae bacterium]|nr:acyl-CoA thioester hydrolase/BAAT C-terminal domain-containing protein [Bryobacteraceae bacterium]
MFPFQGSKLISLLSMGMMVFGQDAAPVFRQHRTASSKSPAQEIGAETVDLPRLASTRQEWEEVRRPELLTAWKQILGKLEPAATDKHWFYDVPPAREVARTELPGYTRIHLELALEKDFWQPSLLLLPKGKGPFPAVIAWTSTTPDWREPEKNWGAWLAERGFVVLTGWSHIRNYRDGTNYGSGAPEKVYERFGRWAGLSRMVWDVRQQAAFLRARGDVDPRRIGFMGFSLSAKTAVYVGAFAPEIAAVVSIDPHIALNGGTNYFAPWYMDWTRKFDDIDTPQKTVLSLLNTDPVRPGLEHDHHELLALTAPRPFLLIGGAGDREDNGGDSDDRQSWGYVNRAMEVYRLLDAPDRLRFALTNDGHHANGPAIDDAWREWLMRWLGRPLVQ